MVHAESPDFAMIKDRIASRETPEAMKSFLLEGGDQGQLQASGDQLKEIFLECILERTRKSLEHLKRAVEAFHVELFSHMYKGKSELIVCVVLRAYRDRNPIRGLQVIEKLWQLGVLEGATGAIQWALTEISKKGEAFKGDELEVKLIGLLAERTNEFSDFMLTLFIQRGFLG